MGNNFFISTICVYRNLMISINILTTAKHRLKLYACNYIYQFGSLPRLLGTQFIPNGNIVQTVCDANVSNAQAATATTT